MLRRYHRSVRTIISVVRLVINITRQLVTPRQYASDVYERRTMIEACRSAARSDVTDQQAVEKLRYILQRDNIYAERVVNSLSQRRYSYIDDRAFRLAEAAWSGHPVQSAPPGYRPLFEKERELGSMPVEAAFEGLVRIVPELDEVRRSVAARSRPLVPGLEEVKKVLGPDSRSSDELARTRLALLVAREYLGVLAGYTQRGDMQTPYFVSVERPVITKLIDRRKRGRE